MNQAEATTLIEEANELHNAGNKLAAAPLYMQAAVFAPFASFALVAGDTYAEAAQHTEAIAAYDLCLAAIPDHEDALAGKKRSMDAQEPKKGFFARWFG